MKKFVYAAFTSVAALALAACGSSEDANEEVMAEDTEILAEEPVTDPVVAETPAAAETGAVDATAAATDAVAPAATDAAAVATTEAAAQ